MLYADIGPQQTNGAGTGKVLFVLDDHNKVEYATIAHKSFTKTDARIHHNDVGRFILMILCHR